ncbi:MAG: tyrosine-type recombinase/integrase [Acetanaerobacterium sp.]
MNPNVLLDCPVTLRDYLFYMETIKGRSPRTVEGYYIDLRTFLRFIKHSRNLVSPSVDFEKITISDVGVDLLRSITLSDVYEFLHFTASERSNSSAARSRKVSSLRGFFGYLTIKAGVLKENPVRELEVPALKKSIPKYLTLENSIELLTSLETQSNESRDRDYCILTLFLNCGMRLSELVGINHTDIRDNQLRLLGKGNKERIVYLNDACMAAISTYETYKQAHPIVVKQDPNALFVSRNGRRISKRRVQQIVERQLAAIGLDHKGFSTHKLRHTAATLMYQHGHVDIRMLKEILGHVNLGTTEVYTHISSEQMEDAAQKNPLATITQRKQPHKTED